MKLLHATLFVSQLFSASSSALPHLGKDKGGVGAAEDIVLVGGNGGINGVGRGHIGVGDAVGGGDAVVGGAGGEEVGEGVGKEVGEGEGEAEGDEIEQEGQLGEPIELGGGDIKTDTLFPPSDTGVFEVEFQNPDARVLTVTENPTPGNAPLGFDFVEPVSYIIQLEGGTEGLTLQKVDYILNAGSTLDISQGQIGKLCTESNTYVVGAGVGELEFEAEENELTLTVDDLNGDWAIFVPSAAGDAAGDASEGGAGDATEVATPTESADAGAGTDVAASTASADAGHSTEVDTPTASADACTEVAAPTASVGVGAGTEVAAPDASMGTGAEVAIGGAVQCTG